MSNWRLALILACLAIIIFVALVVMGHEETLEPQSRGTSQENTAPGPVERTPPAMIRELIGGPNRPVVASNTALETLELRVVNASSNESVPDARAAVLTKAQWTDLLRGIKLEQLTPDVRFRTGRPDGTVTLRVSSIPRPSEDPGVVVDAPGYAMRVAPLQIPSPPSSITIHLERTQPVQVRFRGDIAGLNHVNLYASTPFHSGRQTLRFTPTGTSLPPVVSLLRARVEKAQLSVPGFLRDRRYTLFASAPDNPQLRLQSVFIEGQGSVTINVVAARGLVVRLAGHQASKGRVLAWADGASFTKVKPVSEAGEAWFAIEEFHRSRRWWISAFGTNWSATQPRLLDTANMPSAGRLDLELVQDESVVVSLTGPGRSAGSNRSSLDVSVVNARGDLQDLDYRGAPGGEETYPGFVGQALVMGDSVVVRGLSAYPTILVIRDASSGFVECVRVSHISDKRALHVGPAQRVHIAAHVLTSFVRSAHKKHGDGVMVGIERHLAVPGSEVGLWLPIRARRLANERAVESNRLPARWLVPTTRDARFRLIARGRDGHSDVRPLDQEEYEIKPR